MSRKTSRFDALVLFACVACIVAVHSPLIAYKTFANVDEAYAAALASRLLDGFKLYQGAVSQRGPLMYYLFEGFAWLHGWDNIVALRLWALALALAHFGMTYWMGRQLLSARAALLGAVITAYGLTFGYPPEDAMAINGEPLQLPALLVAVVLGAKAVRFAPGTGARTVRLVVAGLLFGVALSIKQSVALHPLAVLLYLGADARRRGTSPRQLIKDTLALGLTAAVPMLLLGLHAWSQGTIRDLVYYCFTYNSKVHLRPTTKLEPVVATVFFRLGVYTTYFFVLVLLSALALPYLVRRVRALRATRSPWALLRGFGHNQYLALHLLLAVAAASLMYRFFPHYYLQGAPFMSLCCAIAVDPVFKRRPALGRYVTGACTLFVLGLATLGTYFGELVDGRVSHDRTSQDLGTIIEATTKPEDRIFVWGFSPWIYQYAHRRPAGRYVFSTYVTGFVPWYWEKPAVERARIVPGSVEALLGDLDREKPAVVVDAGSVMMGRPMRTYDRPAAWLHEHYCFDMRLGAMDLYRRKPDGGTCAVPYFPRAHGTVDYRAAAMPVPVPRTVDFDASPPLPLGNFWKPRYFLRFPPPPGVDAVKDKRRDKDEAEAEAEGFYLPEVEEIAPVKPGKPSGLPAPLPPPPPSNP